MRAAALLRAMIGVAGQDGGWPIELLGQHDAGEAVRQRDGAERQHELRGVAHLGSQPVRAADQDGRPIWRRRRAPWPGGGRRRRWTAILPCSSSAMTASASRASLSSAAPSSCLRCATRRGPAFADLVPRHRSQGHALGQRLEARRDSGRAARAPARPSAGRRRQRSGACQHPVSSSGARDSDEAGLDGCRASLRHELQASRSDSANASWYRRRDRSGARPTTSSRDCRTRAPRAGTRARRCRRHRSAPSRTAAALPCERGRSLLP